MWVFSKVVQVATVNMVNINPETYGVTLKDPISGTIDNVFEAIDSTRDFDEGVWFGRSTLGDYFSMSSFATRQVNLDVGHLVVRVNGDVYSYEGDINGQIYVKNITSQQDKIKTFTWEYKGETARTKQQVRDFVKKINEYLMQNNIYNILIHNCQKMSTTIKMYAMGKLSYDDAYQDATNQNRQRVNPL